MANGFSRIDAKSEQISLIWPSRIEVGYLDITGVHPVINSGFELEASKFSIHFWSHDMLEGR